MTKIEKVDLNEYPRKKLLEWFMQFEDPYWSVTAEADVTNALAACKNNDISFFDMCLYIFLRSSNETDAFRYRIMDGDVYKLTNIGTTTSLLGDNYVFHTVIVPYIENFSDFALKLKQIKNDCTLKDAPRLKFDEREKFISLNCNPLLSFTAMNFGRATRSQTIPLINWGKKFERDGKWFIPYSMYVNHMFIDAIHLSLFQEKLNRYFDNPDFILN